ncbi:hypothetical protein SAMN05216344_101284 [Polaromonas sp. OV174]|uniref:hypothetical protein n=1 Tax=Polaromonas sp. OV174 TaxID=1855300 RepID=UPI0008DFCC8E|nr:hypothetical protein [Polaromonas sp. OV174]SFB69419.1 hypothetical protein SAMN05216344_101284 [Polaromonas sp. OV174]
MSMHAAPTIRRSTVARLLGLKSDDSMLVLDCTKSFREATVAGDISAAELDRRFGRAWTGRPDRRMPKLVACRVGGAVIRIYKNPQWQQDEKVVPTTGKPTWRFTAEPAPEYVDMVGVDLGSVLKDRGMQNPLYYVNC